MAIAKVVEVNSSSNKSFEDAIQTGIQKVTGVPFFVFDQRIALAGAQPREVFLQVFEKALQTAAVENLDAETAENDQDNACNVPKS